MRFANAWSTWSDERFNLRQNDLPYPSPLRSSTWPIDGSLADRMPVLRRPQHRPCSTIAGSGNI